MYVKANLIIKQQVVIIGNMYNHFFIYSNCEQAWDEKVAACVNFIPRACVYFTPACMCVNFTTLVHKINRKEMIFMEFDFDELTELEIMDLLDQRNYLLNILESGCSSEQESEILDELNHIQEQLDILY